MEYNQTDPNMCCFSSLASALTASVENNAARAIVIQIKESLYCQYKGYTDRIAFANAIIKYQFHNLGEQRLHYNINKLKKTGQF